MSTRNYKSWGFRAAKKQTAAIPQWVDEVAPLLATPPKQGQTRLAYGNGRSYGDSCLNSEGELVDVGALNRFITFDTEKGVLTIEPGVSFASILEIIVPKGWFLPVSPGTSYVTVGGAIANDVHGKNHHRDGTFGRFVKSITLVRSNGEALHCTADTNAELFFATIGGLGLTGVITSATIQLMPIQSTNMDVTFRLFNGVAEFRALAEEYNAQSQYTVAWLDCASNFASNFASKGNQLARGVFMAANHSTDGVFDKVELKPRLSVPFVMPRWLLNKYTINAFNKLYYNKHKALDGKTISQPLKQFFYPLDAIAQWNRIYGAKGFHQYQFVLPKEAQAEFEGLLTRIVESGMGSFLAVLKEFGDMPSPGMLSFPREGLCLALDFADRGPKTEALINELDKMVRNVGGAAYPAKDRLMSAESFQQYFPRHDQFSQYTDLGFSSDFGRRVMPSRKHNSSH